MVLRRRISVRRSRLDGPRFARQAPFLNRRYPMASRKLNGKRVAILATDGVEQSELTEPRKALDEAGAHTVVVSPKPGAIKGWQHDHWGDQIPVDMTLDDARVEDFDALMLP